MQEIEQDLIEIVQTNKNYHYSVLMHNINELERAYPFLKIGEIGYSVLGKKIPYIKIGNGTREVLYHGGIHSNEGITSLLLMKFVEEFCKSYIFNTTIYGYFAQDLFSKVSLYIIPMVNPDGIDFVTGNVKRNTNIYQNYVTIARQYPNIPFPDGWKANFNGVSFINFHLKCCVNRISL